ncbi:MAG: tyrosine-type recombinase/integrase [Hyphomicrobiales bacterium]|nr:tyrosine-type recombinase/integrase [Hyphomicrobiales bacterium]
MTLQNVIDKLELSQRLPETRRRDLRSALSRVAELLDQAPQAIILDVQQIAARLATVNHAAVGMSAKTMANLRAGFLAAVKETDFMPRRRLAGALRPDWIDLLDGQSKRTRLGLARLARFATTRGIAPKAITNTIITEMVEDIRRYSLHRDPNRLHRNTALIWNDLARAQRGLRRLPVPSFAKPPRRIAWATLSGPFRQDVDDYLRWCAGADVFATDARERTLSPRTLVLLRNQIWAAITSLTDAGTDARQVTSLADLVSVRNFKTILAHRHERQNGNANNFDLDLAHRLIGIAREWANVSEADVAELNRLARRLPTRASGLTSKNRATLRQFDDPVTLQKLYALPERLWSEVRRDRRNNFLTLAKAQAAIAIALLCYAPIRLQNLTSLRFDVHLFVRQGRGAISTLEIPAEEVKNRRPLAFDLPEPLARMLREYHHEVAPRILGRRTDLLFVNVDGKAKVSQGIGVLITKILRARIGVKQTPHQFRHLSARTILDAEPGSFETVRQLLGHASLSTTVASYTGIDTARASRHHQQLIESTLAAAPVRFGGRGRRRASRRA